MRRLAPLALPAGLVTAVAALAGGLPGWGEPHLDVVPRTEAEATRIAGAVAPPTSFDAPQPFEGLPGGAATVRARADADAFSQLSANMPFDRQMDFKLGNALFRRDWVSAPSSVASSDGLGPLFNARACQSCHLKDGRGHPPLPGETSLSVLLRVAVPGAGTDQHGIPGFIEAHPDPIYGAQIQTLGGQGHPAEATLAVTWAEREVALAGGETATLRTPTYEATDLAYGPLSPDARLSARIAPQMIGMGLLEAIPESDILAHADEADADGDGVSGRPSIVWSGEFGQAMLGRFGWKAGSATVREQSALAFSTDMGLSTTLAPSGHGDCTDAQPDCLSAPVGADPGGVEVEDPALDLVAFYARNLAVPARRAEDDPQVLRGKEMFHDAQCAACHVPSFVTHRLDDRPEQSFQLVWPYTDLLLHDMGEGLADAKPEGTASGAEWRTAPLWGIGLTAQVNGEANFLHDGRARTVLEAILWHGGEGQAAPDQRLC